MELNGLPLHPLVVHAAVVFGPLAALTALVHAASGRLRDRLRWPMVVAALVATGSVLAAYVTGDDLLRNRPGLEQNAQVDTHEEHAELLVWLTIGFAAVAWVAAWLHQRAGAVRLLLSLALAASALAVLVQVAITGEAGSRAVWGSATSGD